jgi:hypothetical protein
MMNQKLEFSVWGGAKIPTYFLTDLFGLGFDYLELALISVFVTALSKPVAFDEAVKFIINRSHKYDKVDFSKVQTVVKKAEEQGIFELVEDDEGHLLISWNTKESIKHKITYHKTQRTKKGMRRYNMSLLITDIYQFGKGRKEDGLKITDIHGFELSLKDVKQIIDGLTKEYLLLNEEEKRELLIRMLQTEFDKRYAYPFKWRERVFGKNLQRAWGFKCVNCLTKVSSVTHQVYYIFNSHFQHELGYHKRFCSEWCANKFYEEKKAEYVKDRLKEEET